MLVLVFYLAFILYYSSLYGFSKLTKLIIYFVYLYLGDLKTSLNKDKEPLKLKFNNMDYLDEKTLNIALFDKFYCINVICFIGYVGSFIYGIVYLSMEGAIGVIILTMIGSLVEILQILVKFGEIRIGQNNIDGLKNRIKDNASNTCVICLEELQVDGEICQQLKELQCTGKHIFHKNCLNVWFFYNKSCPLCKYKF